MRLTLITFISLDGVVQGPGGPDEDRDGGFDLGGWVAPLWGEDVGEAIAGWFGQTDAFLLGRRTYEIFAGAWPRVTDPDDPVAGPLNSLPKYVASRTLGEVSWNGAELLQGDVAQAVEELKRKPGRELQVHGSGNLAQTLIEHGLIDEYRLVTFPVVLGKGKRLFGAGARPAALRRLEHRDTSTGVSIDVYEAAGAPALGSFEIDESGNVIDESGNVV
jgi:dihydrofolate reductase